MRIIKFLKSHIRKFDLFDTNELFRYKSLQGFHSFCGGFASLLMLIIVIIIFSSRALQCINKVNIYSKESRVISSDPPQFKLQTYPKGKFMAAIQIPGVDLTDPQIKYFNYYLWQYSYVFYPLEIGYDYQETEKYYEFQPCTNAHWQDFPGIAEDLSLLNISQLLCFPMNLSVILKGKYSSFDQKNLKLRINYNTQCQQNETDTPRCPTPQQMEKFFKSNSKPRLQLYFTNFHIVPQSKEHIRYFLDDRYSAFFSNTKGSQTIVYIEDYSIITDQSYFFLQDYVTQIGAFVNERPLSSDFTSSQDKPLVQFQFSKSLTSRIYYRKYKKFEDVFSFVGGFFGVICASLFFLKFYNNCAYQIYIGSELFLPDQPQQRKVFKQYSFLSYLAQIFYKVLKSIGFQRNWEATISYNKCQKQVIQQLDVLNLVRRFLFLESAVQIILDHHHLIGLHLRKKLSLQEAKQQRQSVDFKKEIDRLINSTFAKNTQNLEDFNKLSVLNLNRQQHQDIVGKKPDPFFDKLVLNSLNQITQTNVKFIKDQVQSKTQNTEKFSLQERMTIETEESLKKDKILQDLSKIQQQALRNNKISQKIIDFLGVSVTVFLQAFGFRKNHRSITNFQKKREILGPIFLGKFSTDINSQTPDSYFATPKSKLLESHRAKNTLEIQKNINNKKGKNQAQQQHQYLKGIGKLIQKMDIFSTSKFFRYQSQVNHKTFFGGLVSILMFIISLSLFYEKTIQCIQKAIINSIQSKKVSSDPIELNLSTSPKGEFMAAVAIGDYDISDPNVRYFDFYLQNRIKDYDQDTGQWKEKLTTYVLEMCTMDHWSLFPQLKEDLIVIDINTLLCFPRGITFSLKGKQTSNELRRFDLVMRKCRDQTDPSTPCDKTGKIDSYFYEGTNTSIFRIYIANTLIDPKSKKYVKYFIEDRTFFTAAPEKYNQVLIYFDDFTIITDQSIFPWTTEVTKTGGLITESPIIRTYQRQNSSDQYVRLSMLKSPNNRLFLRSFEKFDQVFAYIGGIFKIILASLFVVNYYNNFNYEVMIGFKLFFHDQNQKGTYKHYNFFSFIKQGIYRFFTAFGLKYNCAQTIKRQYCQAQVKKQLDVVYIVKRLEFLESAISTILQSYQVKGLHLRQKMDFEQARMKRKAFKMKKYLHNFREYIEKKESIPVMKKMSIKQKYLQVKRAGTPDEQRRYNEIQEQVLQIELDRNNGLECRSPVCLIDTICEPHRQQEQIKVVSQSESDDSSQLSNEGERDKIIQNLKRLKKGAQRGHRMSEKIMNLAGMNMRLNEIPQRDNYENCFRDYQNKQRKLRQRQWTKKSSRYSINPYLFQVAQQMQQDIEIKQMESGGMDTPPRNKDKKKQSIKAKKQQGKYEKQIQNGHRFLQRHRVTNRQIK